MIDQSVSPFGEAVLDLVGLVVLVALVVHMVRTLVVRIEDDDLTNHSAVSFAKAFCHPEGAERTREALLQEGHGRIRSHHPKRLAGDPDKVAELMKYVILRRLGVRR